MSKSDTAKQHDDRLRRVARKTGRPVEVCRHAVDHALARVRYYLEHPLEARKGINLRGYLTFAPKRKALYFRLRHKRASLSAGGSRQLAEQLLERHDYQPPPYLADKPAHHGKPPSPQGAPQADDD